MIPALRFSSVDYQRIDGRGDRVTVLCDEDRPRGLAFVVGGEVDIDGGIYRVTSAEHPHLAGPIRRGDRVILWVERAD